MDSTYWISYNRFKTTLLLILHCWLKHVEPLNSLRLSHTPMVVTVNIFIQSAELFKSLLWIPILNASSESSSKDLLWKIIPSCEFFFWIFLFNSSSEFRFGRTPLEDYSILWIPFLYSSFEFFFEFTISIPPLEDYSSREFLCWRIISMHFP